MPLKLFAASFKLRLSFFVPFTDPFELTLFVPYEARSHLLSGPDPFKILPVLCEDRHSRDEKDERGDEVSGEKIMDHRE